MQAKRLPLLFSCALTIAAGPFFAASSTAFAADVGPKINLKPGQSYMGTFVHEHPLKGLDKPMRTEGRFTVTRGEMITWEIEKPIMTNTIITPQGLSQTLGDMPLLSVKARQAPFLSELETDLLWALSGNWEKLRDKFQIATTGTNQAWTVTITPLDQPDTPKPFQQIVAKGGKYVDSADVILPSGATDHLTFADQFVTRQ